MSCRNRTQNNHELYVLCYVPLLGLAYQLGVDGNLDTTTNQYVGTEGTRIFLVTITRKNKQIIFGYLFLFCIDMFRLADFSLAKILFS